MKPHLAGGGCVMHNIKHGQGGSTWESCAWPGRWSIRTGNQRKYPMNYGKIEFICM